MSTVIRLRITREIIWTKGARKAFEAFPEAARTRVEYALTIAAEGSMADIAKPFKGSGGGVFEVALKHGSNAFRALYAAQLGDAVYVFDALPEEIHARHQDPAGGRGPHHGAI